MWKNTVISSLGAMRQQNISHRSIRLPCASVPEQFVVIEKNKTAWVPREDGTLFSRRGGHSMMHTPQHAHTSIKVFYSYTQADEPFCKELEKHLSLLRQQGTITEWHHRNIVPGN